ncbi:MAG: nucleotidyl transferase AbiEii/AbiGii toxin family protein [Alphaproteobacteria bacterium]|nr:nucleotidyl transferase AbiEii/AbiGii toxin family protein [Alphaproteobacteria bacterium]
MTTTITPRLDILPAPQRALWPELAQIPEVFTLWGGTAIALHLGHRTSIDFDFFTDADIDLAAVLASIPLLTGAQIPQREPHTVTAIVERGGPVKLSFFVVPGVLNPSQHRLQAPDNGVHIAALIDLAATKVKVVCDRAEKKDYLDIDAILRLSDIQLAEALATARLVYGDQFAPLPSLKALTYFGDGNLPELPDDVRQRLVEAVRTVDPTRLPSLTRSDIAPPPKDRS